jgi:hypothetical protein
MPQPHESRFLPRPAWPDRGARSGSSRSSRAHTGRSRMPQLRPLPVHRERRDLVRLRELVFDAGSGSHMKSVHLRAFLTSAPTLVEGDIDLRRFTMISTPATR